MPVFVIEVLASSVASGIIDGSDLIEETVVDEKVEDKVTSLKMTRHQKRKIDETHVEGHEELDAASLREHEEFTKVKNIATIQLGRYEIETWYFSPFPLEYNDSVKYFCEFCLNFMKRKEQLQRHMGHEELDAASLREHEEFTKVKNIATIQLGRYEIETWYFSPFPLEYNDSVKYFCEFCLNFMKRKEQLQRHMVSSASYSTVFTHYILSVCGIVGL
nr:histone acetyltransferase of the myst family 2 [Quercus suber]